MGFQTNKISICLNGLQPKSRSKRVRTARPRFYRPGPNARGLIRQYEPPSCWVHRGMFRRLLDQLTAEVNGELGTELKMTDALEEAMLKDIDPTYYKHLSTIDIRRSIINRCDILLAKKIRGAKI